MKYRLSCIRGSSAHAARHTAGSKYGFFGAYLKYGQPPSWRYSEYDLRPHWDFTSEGDNDLEMELDKTSGSFQTGRPLVFLLVFQPVWMTPYHQRSTPDP